MRKILTGALIGALLSVAAWYMVPTAAEGG
jgi:hypothetical protein